MLLRFKYGDLPVGRSHLASLQDVIHDIQSQAAKLQCAERHQRSPCPESWIALEPCLSSVLSRPLALTYSRQLDPIKTPSLPLHL